MKIKIHALLLSAILLLSGCSASTPDIAVESDYDIDFTVLSSTVVYAEVYNMLSSPDDYLGKTVKISGTYTSNTYEDTGITYHFVIISDATACCAQGLEFIWSGAYPEDGAAIEICGTYKTYLEDGCEYCYIDTENVTVK